MLSFIYTVTIYPIQLVLECCYSLLAEILSPTRGSEGLAALGLSVVVTLLTLPLYMIAEKWSERERQTQAKMAERLARIKQAFKGDERYMMQSAFYRQNNYHPIMALRSSFGILIQVPFFVAAYNFLSGLEALNNTQFFFIKDLGASDAAFKIGGFTVNVLPIAMTIINCVAGAIYSKGHGAREKIQIYGMAVLFLIILYNSSAGLVLYWTMNNVLSLVKNIFYKLKNPLRALYICACVAAAILILGVLTFLGSTKTIYKLAMLLLAAGLVFAPLAIKAFNFCIGDRFSLIGIPPSLRFSIFLLSAIGITLLAGLVIPSILMQSEPEQFSYIDDYTSPFVFLRAPLFQAIGLFLFWPACFYALFSDKTKKNISAIFAFLLLLATMNCFLFSGKYGPIEPTLLFMQPQYFTNAKFTLTNIGAIILLIAIFCLILRFKPKTFCFVPLVLVFTFGALSIRNCILINRSFKNMEAVLNKDKIEPVYHLSKTGKNVIVIMQDRLLSSIIPVALDERPDLKTNFDGFKFYPNTISMSANTMFGAPGIFGGYDYTPFYMNQRTDKTLQQKHNEALLTMPVIFSEAGWNVTVSDLPYENFLEQPASKMYEPYPKINHLTVHGTVSKIWCEKNNFQKTNYVSFSCKRNFLLFSIFKMSSPFLRQIIYHGEYWTSKESLYSEDYFINNYSQLDLMDELADGTSDKDSLIIIGNEMTHDNLFLQAPDYVPQKEVTNFGTSILKGDISYPTKISSLLRWSEFFVYLKEQNLYDNTRIIIVSDHGEWSGGNDGIYKHTGRLPFPISKMTAALLVKDFNSRGELEFDNTFMTNADTPYLATKDILPNAKNPFTGAPLQANDKFEKSFIAYADDINTRYRHEKQFKVHGYYKVKENIFTDENWYEYTGDKTE